MHADHGSRHAASHGHSHPAPPAGGSGLIQLSPSLYWYRDTCNVYLLVGRRARAPDRLRLGRDPRPPRRGWGPRGRVGAAHPPPPRPVPGRLPAGGARHPDRGARARGRAVRRDRRLLAAQAHLRQLRRLQHRLHPAAPGAGRPHAPRLRALRVARLRHPGPADAGPHQGLGDLRWPRSTARRSAFCGDLIAEPGHVHTHPRPPVAVRAARRGRARRSTPSPCWPGQALQRLCPSHGHPIGRRRRGARPLAAEAARALRAPGRDAARTASGRSGRTRSTSPRRQRPAPSLGQPALGGQLLRAAGRRRAGAPARLRLPELGPHGGGPPLRRALARRAEGRRRPHARSTSSFRATTTTTTWRGCRGSSRPQGTQAWIFENFAEIVANPTGYNIPCLLPTPIRRRPRAHRRRPRLAGIGFDVRRLPHARAHLVGAGTVRRDRRHPRRVHRGQPAARAPSARSGRPRPSTATRCSRTRSRSASGGSWSSSRS